MPTALVTVGSTSFDRLIRAIDTPSLLKTLQTVHKITRLTIQYGAGTYQNINTLPLPPNFTVTTYRYKPTLQHDLEEADLVISHAGAGSIMEALTLGKKLVVVVNRDLMDDHQEELAEVVAKEGYGVMADVESLEEVLKKADFDGRVQWPERNQEALSRVLRQELK